MDFSNLKKLAMVSAVALTLTYGVHDANAQVSATVGVDFATAAGLSAASDRRLNFGTWVVNIGTGETPVFDQPATVAAGTAVANVTGITGASTIVNTVPGESGSVTVTGPAVTDVVIFGTATDNFASNADLSISQITFIDTNTGTETNLPATAGTDTVNLASAPAAETIGIGGLLEIANEGAALTDATAYTGEITVTFQY